jgi:pimeloyl-ACP methyl ester carboxylesterase
MQPKEQYKLSRYFVDVRRTPLVGRKRAVILIHGIGVSGNYFLPFAELLAKAYDVHVIDMPGYGDVPKPPHPLAPLEQADVIAEYMDKIGLRSAVIVGQSMGCQTAAQMALRHAHFCEKLILIGPTVNKWERRLSLQAFRLFCDTFREPLNMNLVIVHDYFHMGLTAYLVTSRHMITDHIEETLKRVTVPVCIVRGEKDGIAPRRWVEYLAGVPKLGQAHHVKGGPHNIQFTHPKELAAVCKAFLKN